MKKVEDYEFIDNNRKALKNSGHVLLSNFPFDKRILNDLIANNRLYYEKKKDGLYLFADEEYYYELFYLIKNDSSLTFEYLDKDVLVNDIKLVKDDCIVDFNDLYLNNHFKVESINHQVIIDINLYKNSILDAYNAVEKDCKNRNYIIKDCESNKREEAIALWIKNLKKTDIPFDHFNNGNILVLKKDERVIATAWYMIRNNDCEWRHIVVDKDYRGQGIAKLLCCHWLKKMVDMNVNRGISWIEENNTVSQQFHETMGFKKNNRICIQYILEYN